MQTSTNITADVEYLPFMYTGWMAVDGLRFALLYNIPGCILAASPPSPSPSPTNVFGNMRPQVKPKTLLMPLFPARQAIKHMHEQHEPFRYRRVIQNRAVLLPRGTHLIVWGCDDFICRAWNP